MFLSMKIDDWIKKKDFLSSVQSFSIFREEFYMLGPLLLTWFNFNPSVDK